MRRNICHRGTVGQNCLLPQPEVQGSEFKASVTFKCVDPAKSILNCVTGFHADCVVTSARRAMARPACTARKNKLPSTTLCHDQPLEPPTPMSEAPVKYQVQ